jgi:hypothetical protein
VSSETGFASPPFFSLSSMDVAFSWSSLFCYMDIASPPRRTDSHRRHRWREMDSNHRSRISYLTEGSSYPRCGAMTRWSDSGNTRRFAVPATDNWAPKAVILLKISRKELFRSNIRSTRLWIRIYAVRCLVLVAGEAVVQ